FLLPLNFERFTGVRIEPVPVSVKLYESPGRAGGLPRINYGGIKQALKESKVLEWFKYARARLKSFQPGA
ncbi:MAG: hypothetical protein LBD04_11610, partial [Synergistaceae bacterium]|nr:hypothetical protein [Synergistaceae bacterium]